MPPSSATSPFNPTDPALVRRLRFEPREFDLLCQMHGVAAEQQPQRRLIEAGDVEDDGGGLGRIARLGAVIVALETGNRADGGVVLSRPGRIVIEEPAPISPACPVRP
jgi:hypothetical protein